MKNKTPGPAGTARVIAHSGEEHAALALREAAVLMKPIVRWLLRNGVAYPAFADMLKAVFVDTARAELARDGSRLTYSSLSLLSGVHRKDVRTLEEAQGEPAPRPASTRGVPLASQVVTRWLTARRYREKDGTPKPLKRSGSGASFESLANELSQDVHPRAVLEESLRLGMVSLDGDTVVPVGALQTPTRRMDEVTALFAANAADHIAAAVDNLTVDAPPRLERSIFADGLGQDSIDHLHAKALAVWQKAFEMMVREATRCVDADADLDAPEQRRMRFGVYFYSEAQNPPAAPTAG